MHGHILWEAEMDDSGEKESVGERGEGNNFIKKGDNKTQMLLSGATRTINKILVYGRDSVGRFHKHTHTPHSRCWWCHNQPRDDSKGMNRQVGRF